MIVAVTICILGSQCLFFVAVDFKDLKKARELQNLPGARAEPEQNKTGAKIAGRFLVSNGTVRLLESRTGILGCLAETAQPAAAEEVELASGDRLVLYTDGLIEVFNSCGDMLGVAGLEKLVRQSATRALPEMKQAILDDVAAWRHGTMADDVSLVIVEVR